MLARAIAAAYHGYLQQPERYRELYQRYLHTDPLYLPETDPHEATPLPRRLRLGCFPRAPYYFEGKGFEKELAEAVLVGVEIEWVECHPQGMDGGGLEIFTAFDQFVEWLQQDRFDVAWAGLLARPEVPVQVACETMRIFPGALATGRQALPPVKNRQELVDALKTLPHCHLLSTPGGPSETATQKLQEETGATRATARVPEILEAIEKQTADLVVGDCLGLASLGRGHFLNVDVAPEQAARVVAFTLP